LEQRRLLLLTDKRLLAFRPGQTSRAKQCLQRRITRLHIGCHEALHLVKLAALFFNAPLRGGLLRTPSRSGGPCANGRRCHTAQRTYAKCNCPKCRDRHLQRLPVTML
jgi:hypothetical protein